MKSALAALLVAVVLGASGCATAPQPAPGEIFRQYLDSTDVINDEFSGSATGPDRIANFAAHFRVEQLRAFVLTDYGCDEPEPRIGGYQGRAGCPPAAAVTAAARDVDPQAPLRARNLVVRHGDGRLELMPIYFVSAGRQVLIDRAGETYPGGLDDFRARNGILTAEDSVLVPADPFTTTGGELVVVSGREAGVPVWVVVLGGVAVIGAAVVVVVRRRGRE